jgi:hypothetical protein
MKRYGLCLWVGLGLLGAAGTGRALELDLKYKMKPGQELQYHDWLVMASLSTSGGEESRVQMESEAFYQQRVVSLENGVYELENRTLRGKWIIRADEEERSEDIKERTEIVTLDERGKVLSRKKVDGEEEEEEGSLMDPSFPLQVLDQVYENLLFPSKAIKIGKTWTDQADIKLTSDQTVSVDLVSKVARLVKVKGRNCAEIKTHFVVPVSASEEPEGVPVKTSVEGQVVGDLTLYFAYEEGIDLVHFGEIKVILDTTMEVAGETQEHQTKMKIRLKTVLQEGE